MRSFTVNANLRRIIDDRHVSHSKFADAVGMRRDTFSRVLACKRPLFADEIGPIARELNIPLDVLLADDRGERVMNMYEGFEKFAELLAKADAIIGRIETLAHRVDAAERGITKDEWIALIDQAFLEHREWELFGSKRKYRDYKRRQREKYRNSNGQDANCNCIIPKGEE